MKLRKAWLLVLLLALTQLLAAASAGDAHEDTSDTENATDDLEVKEENGVWVLNDGNFDNFVADKDTVLLEFYAPWCGHCKQFAPEYENDVVIIGLFQGDGDPAYLQYQDAANNLREDYKFHHTFSPEIAKFLKVSLGKLVLTHPEKFQSKYEPRFHVMDVQGSTEASAIKDYVVKHALPLVGHRKTSNDAKRYSKRPLVVVYYSVDFSFDYRAATQFWRNKVLEVAKDFPEYTFAIADEEDYATEVKDLGLSESGEDVNAAILDESGKKFAMEPEEFDSDTLREFVTAFKKGKLKPVIKSQPVPKNNKGPVKVVVGKTFDAIVMDPKKDVLIDKGQKDLVIAKMDATANDITNDQYKVEGFPTIYFAPSGDKKNPIKFEGGNRDLEHLSKFIDEHATKRSRTKEEL